MLIESAIKVTFEEGILPRAYQSKIGNRAGKGPAYYKGDSQTPRQPPSAEGDLEVNQAANTFHLRTSRRSCGS